MCRLLVRAAAAGIILFQVAGCSSGGMNLPDPPPAPQGLKAVKEVDPIRNKVTLSWDKVTEADFYNVYRGEFKLVMGLVIDGWYSPLYTDTGTYLGAGTGNSVTHYYAVTACAGTPVEGKYSESPYSEVITVGFW